MSIVDKIRGFFRGRAPGGPSGNGGAPGGDGAGMPSEMIPCEEALRLVNEFLDGELEGVSHAQVEAHFDVCQRCYPHLQLETAFREAMRRAVAGQEAPGELKAKVAALISEADAEE